ncbi:unnamed protein product [Urochloa decumbens]|uniref:Uncharacterized protein n=1 Tax=Urochloa decumbens TaxID=240449 RepID=A0ABC8Z0Y1_9POAL
MDKDKKLASLWPLLVMTVVKKKKAAAPFQAVRQVSLWALLSAASLVGYAASAYALNHYHVRPPSWLTGLKPTGAAAAVRNLVAWWSAAAAAAAALALLLPECRRQSRRALAYAALAATANSHLMFIALLRAGPDTRGIFWWIGSTADVVMLVAIDIDCALALLGRGAYANAPAC